MRQLYLGDEKRGNECLTQISGRFDLHFATSADPTGITL
jgi:hypothetical protein